MRQEYPQDLASFVRNISRKSAFITTALILCVSVSGALAFPNYQLPVDIISLAAGSYIESSLDTGLVTFATPEVTTNAASNVTGTTATLNGMANPNGEATTGWFRYSFSDPGICDDTFGVRAPASGGSDVGSGISPVPFSQDLAGLTPDATVYYCAMAQNASGISFGAVISFTPQFAAPTVITDAANSLSSLGATLNGTAVANGSSTTGWFRYATTDPGTCNDTFGTRAPAAGGTSIGSGTDPVPFSQAITGLTPATTYFVCAIAQNGFGTSFGSVSQVTTPAEVVNILVTPGTLNYGNQTLGTTSAEQSITITNQGTAPLVLGDLFIIGSSDFSFSDSPSGAVVQPGQSVTASFTFTPSDLGERSATVFIPSNASEQPTVELIGFGVIADIDVSLADIDFGTVLLSMGGSQLLTVSNFGSEDLAFICGFTGANASDFSNFMAGQVIVVPSGQSIDLAILFNPQAIGNRSATLTLSTNDPDEPSVAISLVGVAINSGLVQFSAASYSGNEGDGTIALTVQRVGGSQGAVSAFFSAAGGLATGGEDACGGGIDYVNSIPFANFADGDAEPKTVLITVCDDAFVENTETFNIQMFAEGAGLGPDQAVVAITDNDVAGQISISGTITRPDNSQVEQTGLDLRGASTATVFTDDNGQFTFQGLTSGSYVVAPIENSLVFDPISRNYSNRTTDVTDANFTAYVPGTEPRTLTVLTGFATPGQQALVPVMLQSQGNEAGLTFSLDYDPAFLDIATVECGSAAGAGCSLTVNTTTPGRIGISVDPVAPAFETGNREVVRVLFFTSVGTSVLNTPVTFVNTPAIPEISDGDANPLLTRYIPGSIVFIHGIESDVAVRPSGDGAVSSIDVAQVRRFAVGLDTFDAEDNEFQRADSSPYATAGDGVVAATDITQARRYQIGADPTQPAGGPSTASSIGPGFEAERSALSLVQAPRVVRVVNASGGPGSQVTVALQTDAEGDENVYGFSLSYDPAILSAPVVTIGGDATGGNVLANTTQAGRIGFSVDFGSSAMPAGSAKELVKIRFDISPTAPAGQTPLGFGDAPAFRETSNSGAQSLETTYSNGFVTILGPTAADASISGRVLTTYGRAISGAIVRVQDANGLWKTSTTNTFGYYRFTDLQAGETYIVSVSARRYQFAVPTHVVSLLDNVAGLDFVGTP